MPSSFHALACATTAPNRSVCPAIQLAMYPPKEPPMTAVRVASISGRASAASVTAIRSSNVASPHRP